jgi:hypothetical protein
MRPFTATVRCLALASLGFGALPTFAHSANVTAFSPYDGVGTSAAPVPTEVYAMPQGNPTKARKVALSRALSVCSASNGDGAGSERVDVLGS